MNEIESLANKLNHEQVVDFLSQHERICPCCQHSEFTLSVDPNRSAESPDHNMPLLVTQRVVMGFSDEGRLDFSEGARWTAPEVQLICRKCFNSTYFPILRIAGALLNITEDI